MRLCVRACVCVICVRVCGYRLQSRNHNLPRDVAKLIEMGYHCKREPFRATPVVVCRQWTKSRPRQSSSRTPHDSDVIQADASSISLGLGGTSAAILCDALTHVSSHTKEFFLFTMGFKGGEDPFVVFGNVARDAWEKL